jgi:hypothetical protein
LYDYLVVVALCSSAILLAEGRREPTVLRARLVQMILGGVLIASGLVGWFYFGGRAFTLQNQLPQPRMGGELTYRPALSKVILAYHGQTPLTGGPVLFADGSVTTLDKAGFAQQEQATPAEYTPIDPIVPFSGEITTELSPEAMGGTPQEILKRAEQRAKVNDALKRIGTSYYKYSRDTSWPPRRIDELNLPPDLEAEVRAGTYAVHLGWGLTPPHTIALEEQLRAALFLRWASFHLGGVGLALLLGARMARISSTPSTAP